jgi:hypothetical protein
MNKSERPDRREPARQTKSTPVDDGSLAVAALRFFAEDRDRAERFFTWSGLEAGSIRAAARQAGFGASVLDFLMQDEALLVSFAEHAGLDPADISAAYQASKARDRAWEADV